MQQTKSRSFIVGFAALALLVGICFFMTQGAYAETAVPADETTATEPTGVVNDWKDGLYYDGTGTVVVSKTIKTSDGKVYSFDAAGAGTLYTGVFEGKQYSKGVLLTGKLGGKYYVKGSLYTGVANNIRYKAGVPLTGFYSSKYYKSGKVYSGVYGSYYYKSGVKQTKYKSVVKKMNNGKIYCFGKTGKVYKGTGWKRVSGKRYYFKKGVALTGWHYVGKYKYYFYSSGKLCQDLIAKDGSKWKKRSIYIKVNRKKNCVTLFAKDGKKGYTIPVKAMACSVGKAATPTVKGTYYLTKSRTYRWAKLGGPTMGGYCYGQYCSRITGSYLFHSVTYRQKNNRTLSSTAYNNLGGPASHGCIRLQTGNAKIIYDIARYNKKTKVTIYDGKSAGPFDKPKVKKIRAGQSYDPTDPAFKKK